MYPSISHLLYDVFGLNITLPIQSFGFFVMISFLCGAFVLKKIFHQRYAQGLFPPLKEKIIKGRGLIVKEVISQIVFGFLLGFKLFYAIENWIEFSQNPQAYLLSSEGSFIGGVLVSLVALSLLIYENKKEKQKYPEQVELEVEKLPKDMVMEITFAVGVAGFLGAKLFHFLEYPETIPDLFTDPASAIFSGLTFYGGLLFGFITAFYFAKKMKIHVLSILDAAAPSLILSYGAGRLGCHFSGDGDWGIVNTYNKPEFLSFLPDWLWAYRYPHNVNGEGVLIENCDSFWGYYCYQLEFPVFPTPLYEFIMCLTLFGILYLLRNKWAHLPGLLFSIYLVLNGIERFLIEKIRVNVVYDWGVVKPTQAELISLIMIIVGLAAFYFLKRKYQKSSL
jgi:prolipoprotein diacylglyceryltransferase